MSVTEISSSPATQNNNSANNNAQSASTGEIDADFDTFLSLLTAQLQNQDPLKPIDSTDFVAQLAQFSAVEQQVRSNDALEAILAAVSKGDVGELASWIGVEVEAAAPLKFEGQAISFRTNPDPTTTAAQLVVLDSSGATVSRAAIDSNASEVVWDGKVSGGGEADHGFYSFFIERTSAEGAPERTQLAGFSRVIEVRLEDGETKLSLEGGGATSADDIRALREAI